MFRCMTCDRVRRSAPVFVGIPNGESIGLCEACATVIRSYNTLVALAQGEYDELQAREEAEAKCGTALCCDDPGCPDRKGVRS